MKNFNELINGERPVLVDFFATWCGPCKMMHPVLEQLKSEMGERAHVVKIDIDNEANRAIASQYNIQSVPTLMIFRGGEMLWRQSGVASAHVLKEKLEEFDK